MAKPKIDYIKRAKIAREAGLYRGPFKNLTKSNKSEITKLFNKIPFLANKHNNYKSVAVPKGDLVAWEKRGFKTYKGKVLVNMQGATRVIYSKRFKRITAIADTDVMYRRNRYSLDGDLEKMMALTEENDTMLSLTQGGEGNIGRSFSVDDFLNYTEQLKADLEPYGKSYTPAITEVVRKSKSRGKLALKNSVPKIWDFEGEN
jgi:hypothetical protein